MIRGSTRRILERLGYKVLLASDGEEALKILRDRKERVHLVLSDVVMPRLDGFGLIRGIRRLYPGLPVIVLSADRYYDGYLLEEVAAQHGAVATLVKPFDITVLQEAVRKAVKLPQPAARDGSAGAAGRAA